MGTALQSSWNQTQLRALELLGSGLTPTAVGMALGVTESRIGQMLSEPDFATAVGEKKFHALQKHNTIDAEYDDMEIALQKSLREQLPLMQRPMEILKAIQVLNAAKRRGTSAPEQITHQNTVVQLLMPTQITQKFTTNINNQVIVAGDQTLETIQSSSLLAATKQKAQSLHHESPGFTRIEEIVTGE